MKREILERQNYETVKEQESTSASARFAKIELNQVIRYCQNINSSEQLSTEREDAFEYLTQNLDVESYEYFRNWLEMLDHYKAEAKKQVGGEEQSKRVENAYRDSYANLHYELDYAYAGGYFRENDGLYMMLFLAREAAYTKYEGIGNDEEHLQLLYEDSNIVASELYELMSLKYEKKSTAVSAQVYYHMLVNMLSNCRSDTERKAVIFPVLDAFVYGNQYPVSRAQKEAYLSPSGFAEAEGEFGETTFNEIIRIFHLLLKEMELSMDEVDYLVSSVLAAPSPILINSLAETLSGKESKGVEILLKAAGEEEELCRKTALAILFRLELGKIGISEQGLDYLGRRFDLGISNNPNYFVQRITASGKVGVFDQEQRLKGFVQLTADDFREDQTETIKKDVQEIVTEMLFAPNPDETEQDRKLREEILEEFKAKYFSTYIEMFGKNSDLRFNNLELPEQGWVLQYLQRADGEQKDRFFEFISQFGEDGFRAFRSLEFGEEMAQQILTVAKKTDLQTARAIFKQYSRTIDLTKQVVSFAEQNLNPKVFGEEKRQRMTLGLLRRGRDLIATYSSNPPEAQRIRAELKDMVAEVQLLAESFRVAGGSEHELKLEDFNTNIEIHNGQELGSNQEMRAELIRIFNLNWDNAESDKAYPYMLKDLELALTDPVQKFYLIKHGDEMIGFQRFKPYKDGEVYAASNNIRKTAQKSGIGGVATRIILDWEAAQHKVVAHAYSGHNAITHYLAKDGFVAIALEQYEDTEDLDFVIVRDDRTSGSYHYQGASQEKIINDYNNKDLKDGAEIIELDTEDKTGFYSAVSQRTNSGMVVTSFFRPDENSNRAFIVFEQAEKRMSKNLEDQGKLPKVA